MTRCIEEAACAWHGAGTLTPHLAQVAMAGVCKGVLVPSVRAGCCSTNPDFQTVKACTCSAARRCSMARAPPSTAQE